MNDRAFSFEVFTGASSSPTGPDRLPVVFYDADERRQLLPGPLLPDVTRRVEIARLDNPSMAARLGFATFTQACAEVTRALITGYTLWMESDADSAPEGIDKLVQIEFREIGFGGMQPANGKLAFLHGNPGDILMRRHGVVYNPSNSSGSTGALCWTASSVRASDGVTIAIYAYIVAPPIPLAIRAAEFPIVTCQEADALFRAVSSGRSGNGWVNLPDKTTRQFAREDLVHRVSVELTPDEIERGIRQDVLTDITISQDADGCLAIMYVSHLLTSPGSHPGGARATAWIDLDDVAGMVWPAPRSRAERIEHRRRIYHTMRFCERAVVKGRRTGRYREKTTGKEIDTRMEGPIWRLMEVEESSTAGADSSEPPVRVRLVVSPAWSLLTSHPNLAQYLPSGEKLGAIPGGKPSGAWARAIGMSLAGFWRRHPSESLSRSLLPTRRELLARYAPALSPPNEVLLGHDPGRALEYWRGALQILVDQGFLAKSGEAGKTLEEMRKGLPRYNWRESWMDQHVEMPPGECVRTTLVALGHKRKKLTGG